MNHNQLNQKANPNLKSPNNTKLTAPKIRKAAALIPSSSGRKLSFIIITHDVLVSRTISEIIICSTSFDFAVRRAASIGFGSTSRMNPAALRLSECSEELQLDAASPWWVMLDCLRC